VSVDGSLAVSPARAEIARAGGRECVFVACLDGTASS